MQPNQLPTKEDRSQLSMPTEPEYPAIDSQPFSYTKQKLPKNKKVVVIIVLCVGVLAGIAAYITWPTPKMGTNPSTISPARVKLNECIKGKGVDSSNWTAYQKATEDCSVETGYHL